MAPTRRRDVRSPFAIGLIALIVISILVFLGFTKDIPFTRPYEVKAVFRSSNGLRVNSPVRIAGVEVGKVKKVDAQDGTDNAVVTMAIDKSGLPLHRDATAKIRPRIFLEGNFFIDVQPGTPGAPELDDGETLGVTQTATPVQLDQVLTALQSDTRQDLRDVLEGLGTALRSKPSAADDRDADRSARGETAAESFNDAYDDIGPAERAQSQVNEAFLGLEPEQDLARLIEGAGKTAAGLVRNETQLQELVSNFNATMAALASEESNLRASIRELAPTLENANGALASLNDAFPPTRAFAREILPGVRETLATIDASFPWIEQARGLMRKSELRPRPPDRQGDRAAAADRPRLQVRQPRRAPDRRRRDPRRVPDRARELQGLLLRARRARRRGAELRRQRHDGAVPDRRRLAAGIARPGLGRLAAAVRRAADAAARQPPLLPGQDPAVQARPALLQAEAA
jgi:virulence factor Mce-like protein